ncbi:TIGR02221 family CRISPR-associated protein [Hydrogenivirga sp. 128-5-R1-1]|uniref:TIGR02221 family CRISPR-associated protein n=1 Tax=Hydrogenivirga sp. 128-5-R1-1 TaxID=392423 RepID=UPI00015F176F|nr:TIGR02221 family CRISPR-associated protein [Hydrogenivirga sp. 128-5-R1-1]EDP76109.1 hypothetical protein HG1285_18104 [Hydrogenivirga sp. 128-5-R1-1]
MKVLISTLGRGQYDKEKNRYDYKESTYVLSDGSEVKTKLVSKALLDYVKPDEVYIIGTKESLWNLADELIGNYRKVLIPYGKTREEFWEMFRIINDEIDVSGKDIYLDITHGFRAIPLLVSTVANLFSKVKGANVKGLFYGIFEAKDEKGRTPVVDLLPILELNEWIEGFTLFKNYGEGDFLAELIDRKLSELGSDERKKAGNLNKLPKLLRKYSQAVGFTALDFMPTFARQVTDAMSGVGEQSPSFTAVDLLKDSFKTAYAELEKEHEEEWLNQYKLAEWLFNKRRYSQATIALEECIFTYVMENLGLEPLHETRKKLGGAFHEDRDKNVFFSPELNALFSKVQDLRNKTGHAFMQKDVSERHIKEAVENLKRYIDGVREVLTRGRVRDEESLKSYLGIP